MCNCKTHIYTHKNTCAHICPTMALSPPFKEDCLALPLSTPLFSSWPMVWCPLLSPPDDQWCDVHSSLLQMTNGVMSTPLSSSWPMVWCPHLSSTSLMAWCPHLSPVDRWCDVHASHLQLTNGVICMPLSSSWPTVWCPHLSLPIDWWWGVLGFVLTGSVLVSHSDFCSKLIESVRMMACVIGLSPFEVIQQTAWVTASTSIVKLVVKTVYWVQAALSSKIHSHKK